MCLYHYNYHLACGHLTINLDRTINSHCTAVQADLYRYHTQETAGFRGAGFEFSMPPPTKCPQVPHTDYRTWPEHFINYRFEHPPLRALTAHPEPDAERRTYQGWSRFNDRHEMDPFFAGDHDGTRSSLDQPSLAQLATIFASPTAFDGQCNVQITPVGFGCGNRDRARCTWERTTDRFRFFELIRATEEEDHRNVCEVVQRIGRLQSEIEATERSLNEILMVEDRWIQRRNLPRAVQALRREALDAGFEDVEPVIWDPSHTAGDVVVVERRTRKPQASSETVTHTCSGRPLAGGTPVDEETMTIWV